MIERFRTLALGKSRPSRDDRLMRLLRFSKVMCLLALICDYLGLHKARVFWMISLALALYIMFGTAVGRQRLGNLLYRLFGKRFGLGAAPPAALPPGGIPLLLAEGYINDRWRDAHRRCKLAPYLAIESTHGQLLYKYVDVNSKDTDLVHVAYDANLCGDHADLTPPVYAQVEDHDDADLSLFVYVNMKTGGWNVNNRDNMISRGINSMVSPRSQGAPGSDLVEAGTLPQEAEGWGERTVFLPQKVVTLSLVDQSNSRLTIDCTNLAGDTLATVENLPADIIVEEARARIMSNLEQERAGECCSLRFLLLSGTNLEQVIVDRPGAIFLDLF
jgi:hypothetical protein